MKTVSPHLKNCENFTSFVFAALSCEVSSGILKEKFHISVTLRITSNSSHKSCPRSCHKMEWRIFSEVTVYWE